MDQTFVGIYWCNLASIAEATLITCACESESRFFGFLACFLLQMTPTLLLVEDTVLRISPVYTVFWSLHWHMHVGLDTGGAESACPAHTAQFCKLAVSHSFFQVHSYRGNE